MSRLLSFIEKKSVNVYNINGSRGNYMRKEAYQILRKIDEQQAYSNIILNEYLSHCSLSRADQDLLTKIVYGVMSNQLFLAYQLKQLASASPKRKIRTLLYLSLYQIYFLDKVPSYAICDEAVKLAKTLDPRISKFVNAVLRKAIEQGPVAIHTGNALEDLSILYSMPLPLVKYLSKQYDYETLEAILKDSLDTPKQCIRVNRLKANPQTYDYEKGTLVETSLFYPKGNVAHSSEYIEGYFSIQDEASQLVALWVDPRPGETILDMCSAPGGKSCHMAELMDNKGHIDAFDLYEHKVALINQGAKRLGIDIIHARIQDATKLEEGCYDKILLDGPCSGLGVLKRKPEIKYRDFDFKGLIKLQREMLSQVNQHLNVGGTLVYSTCTLNKHENEENIQWFLKAFPQFKLIQEQTILPYEYHSDGFYIAKLMKQER